MLGEAAQKVAQWVFGGTCFLCRGAAKKRLLCEACDADLPRLRQALCPRCALPSAGAEVCGQCLAHPPHFDAARAALAYRFPADVLLQAFKFRGELTLAGFFAALLVERLGAAPRADYLVPVPIAAARLRERGYNQALEIARQVARATGIRLAPGLCERVRDTPPQTDLPWSERAKNVRGAFRAPLALDGAAVAVLDDVMTTGATLGEIAATLKSAGAAHVSAWVVARTFPPAEDAR